MCSRFSDEMWMRHAIFLANCAARYDEVSVGAVLVLNNRIIGSGWNSPIVRHDPTAHAEILALRQGGSMIGNYRLLNTTLYVTLEPCIMCFGAMLHARIFRLVFGARDKKNGIVASQRSYLNCINTNHRIVCTGGVLGDLCSNQIINFFYRKRLKNCLYES